MTNGWYKLYHHILSMDKIKNLHSNAFRILIYIMRYTLGFHKDSCNLTFNILKKETGMSVNAIRRGFNELLKNNIIETKRNRNLPTTIVLNLKTLEISEMDISIMNISGINSIEKKYVEMSESNKSKMGVSIMNKSDKNKSSNEKTDMSNVNISKNRKENNRNVHNEQIEVFEMNISEKSKTINESGLKDDFFHTKDNIKDINKDNNIIINNNRKSKDFQNTLQISPSKSLKKERKFKSEESKQKSERAIFVNQLISSWCNVFTEVFEGYNDKNPYTISKTNGKIRGHFNLIADYINKDTHEPKMDLNMFENILKHALTTMKFYQDKLEVSTFYNKIDYFRHNYNIYLQRQSTFSVVKGEIENGRKRRSRVYQEHLELYNKERKFEGKEPVDKLPWDKSKD